MPKRPSLRVSIPLDRLPNYKENTEGNLSMALSNASNRLIDAQLLVAFSTEAREKATVSNDSELAASTPDDPQYQQPSEPKAAKLSSVNKYTQTEGRIGELIEIIETNEITRRQLLRLVGHNDKNNNGQNLIEIDENEHEYDENLLEEIKSKSDQAKQLLQRIYNGIRPGDTINLYNFINGCLVDKSKDGDKIVEIVDDSTPAENANDKDQEEINGNTAAEEPYNDSGISTERLPAINEPARPVSPVSPEVPTGESARALPVAVLPSQQMNIANPYEYLACLYDLLPPAIKDTLSTRMTKPPPPPLPSPPTAHFNVPPPMSAYRSATSYQVPNLQQVNNTFNPGASATNQQPTATNQPKVNSQPCNIGYHYTIPPPALPAFCNGRSVGSYTGSRQPTPQFFTSTSTSSGTFQPVLPRESWNPWQNYTQQQTTEQPSASKTRRGRPKVTPVRGVVTPVRGVVTPVRGVSQPVPPSFQGQPYNKYKYMMGQQRAWQSQYPNYPNASWGTGYSNQYCSNNK